MGPWYSSDAGGDLEMLWWLFSLKQSHGQGLKVKSLLPSNSAGFQKSSGYSQ